MLWSRIREAAAVDVGVAECRRAIGQRGRLRRAEIARLKGGSPGVDRWAVYSVAGVVPYRCAVRPRCRCIDVIAQELVSQCVGARSSRVARRPAVELAERTRAAG